MNGNEIRGWLPPRVYRTVHKPKPPDEVKKMVLATIARESGQVVEIARRMQELLKAGKGTKSTAFRLLEHDLQKAKYSVADAQAFQRRVWGDDTTETR